MNLESLREEIIDLWSKVHKDDKNNGIYLYAIRNKAIYAFQNKAEALEFLVTTLSQVRPNTTVYLMGNGAARYYLLQLIYSDFQNKDCHYAESIDFDFSVEKKAEGYIPLYAFATGDAYKTLTLPATVNGITTYAPSIKPCYMGVNSDIRYRAGYLATNIQRIHWVENDNGEIKPLMHCKPNGERNFSKKYEYIMLDARPAVLEKEAKQVKPKLTKSMAHTKRSVAV